MHHTRRPAGCVTRADTASAFVKASITDYWTSQLARLRNSPGPINLSPNRAAVPFDPDRSASWSVPRHREDSTGRRFQLQTSVEAVERRMTPDWLLPLPRILDRSWRVAAQDPAGERSLTVEIEVADARKYNAHQALRAMDILIARCRTRSKRQTPALTHATRLPDRERSRERRSEVRCSYKLACAARSRRASVLAFVRRCRHEIRRRSK